MTTYGASSVLVLSKEDKEFLSFFIYLFFAPFFSSCDVYYLFIYASAELIYYLARRFFFVLINDAIYEENQP